MNNTKITEQIFYVRGVKATKNNVYTVASLIKKHKLQYVSDAKGLSDGLKYYLKGTPRRVKKFIEEITLFGVI